MVNAETWFRQLEFPLIELLRVDQNMDELFKLLANKVTTITM